MSEIAIFASGLVLGVMLTTAAVVFVVAALTLEVKEK
jgi:hypothetical protein